MGCAGTKSINCRRNVIRRCISENNTSDRIAKKRLFMYQINLERETINEKKIEKVPVLNLGANTLYRNRIMLH
ncbi:hypothetical protein SteCoe_27428 [Stentor coeruleus]|uniref:Uncharacterized protein n=1 Tax=Stentor coeruleus TaxID=5963 RepID=A0A1R2BAW1_9CILI|nr:hypothetical protein SteCoe_27428 [Stentor coeruleus]